MTQDAVASTRKTCSSSQLIPPGPSDPQPISGRAVCLDVPPHLAPHWTKVQYLFSFDSHKVQIIFLDRSLSAGKMFESIPGHSTRTGGGDMPQKSVTVYVVDDDESIRRALKPLLRSADQIFLRSDTVFHVKICTDQ